MRAARFHRRSAPIKYSAGGPAALLTVGTISESHLALNFRVDQSAAPIREQRISMTSLCIFKLFYAIVENEPDYPLEFAGAVLKH